MVDLKIDFSEVAERSFEKLLKARDGLDSIRHMFDGFYREDSGFSFTVRNFAGSVAAVKSALEDSLSGVFSLTSCDQPVFSDMPVYAQNMASSLDMDCSSGDAGVIFNISPL